MSLSSLYRSALERGELKPDDAQARAVERLRHLADALGRYRPGRRLFFRRPAPRGLYIWGDVGRGKSMLMDLFFEAAPVSPKRRAHFNAFMVDVHERIHRERQSGKSDDPIPPVARALAAGSTLLCFDEFQVTDVADAMILGRLFEQLFARGVVVVATSNVAPGRLYEGGLNRELFLPFIAMLTAAVDVFALDGAVDYRLHRMGGLKVYMSPLSAETDREMDRAWLRLTGVAVGPPMLLTVLGRALRVSQAARGVARFSFDDLCVQPLAAPDYLAIAHHFHTVMIDRIPKLKAEQRNEARRLTLLIDTLYDEGVKLVCSAEGQPDEIYPEGENAETFRRAASRLVEMQSDDYLRRGHGIRSLAAD